MSRAIPIPSYRVLLKVTTIIALVDILNQVKSTNGLSKDAADGLAKLKVELAKAESGLKTPDYISTGTSRISVSNMSVEDLGGYNPENTTGDNIAASLFGTSPNNESKSSNLPADLNEDMEAELLRLEAAMLAEVAGNGAGSENVIPERRKTPRIPHSENNSNSNITPDDL